MAGEVGIRVRRVGEGVREELANLVAHELKDPRAAGAIVTGVEMTPDLRSARVRIRLLSGAEDIEARRRVIEGLDRAAGMLRREVAQRLRLRVAPELKFVYDDGADRSTRVDELLAEIEAERRRQH